MNFARLGKTARHSCRFLKKHSPEIMTAIGLIGMIKSGIDAVKVTPKAVKLLEEKKKELNKEKLTAAETVETTWKCYVGPIVTAIVSTGCIIGGQSESIRRNLALASAYKVSETALSDYKQAVIESVGKDKESEIIDKMVEKKIQNSPPPENHSVIIGSGRTLCYDNVFGGYWMGNIDEIKRAFNELNDIVRMNDSASLNDLRELVGADPLGAGGNLGWEVSDGMVTVKFSGSLTPSGEPCLAITYDPVPHFNFDYYG